MSHMTLKKPQKGTAAKLKRARRAEIERAERTAKRAAIRRDGGWCRHCGIMPLYPGPEAAHISDKGMGGDHGLRSSKASDYVTLCHSCHQGLRSVHSGHLRICAGPAGGDGPVTFESVVPGRKNVA